MPSSTPSSLPQCIAQLDALAPRLQRLQFLMEEADLNESAPSPERVSFLQDIRQGRLEIQDCLQLARDLPQNSAKADEVLQSLLKIVSVWSTLLDHIDQYLLEISPPAH